MSDNKYECTSLRLNESNINDIYIYVVKNMSGGTEYIGAGRMSDIISMKAVRNNVYYNPNESYDFCILNNYHYKNKLEAANALSNLIKVLYQGTPRMNVGYKGYINDRKIVCVETGEVFNNAREICRKYNINPGQISSHLNGRCGYNKVHGMTFEYASELAKKEKLKELTRFWTPVMYEIDPIDWTIENTGLSEETFDKCVREYYSQEMFVHRLDKNPERKGRVEITSLNQRE